MLISFQMLQTVLNIIMFEDCRNQWGMSRPLFVLILLNEEVHLIQTLQVHTEIIQRNIYEPLHEQKKSLLLSRSDTNLAILPQKIEA